MAKKHNVGCAQLSDILGNAKIADIPAPTGCMICGKPIPAVRIKVLKSMKTPLHKWAHTHCSTVTKIKGIYLGESGTSELFQCDKIYDDNVRSVFRKVDVDPDDKED